ncbi:MAG: polymerase sigma-54 factor [Planctomycetota bacterium]
MAGMRFETSQGMKLGQTMGLSPKLIQSAEILQLNSMELQERIEQEIEKNFALELVMPGASDDGDARRERHLEEAPQGGGSTEFERLRRLERQYGEQWNSDGDSRRATRDNRERDPKMDAMANAPSRGASLADQLLEQWRFAEIHDPSLRVAGARLIEYIDDDGLMQTPLETVREQSAHLAGCDWAIDTLKLALERLQQELEPRGIGATSVREALLIEARAYLDEETDLDRAEAWGDAIALIEKHYDDLLHNRIPRIRESNGWNSDRLDRARACLKRLDPNPGRELVPPESTAIVPDVIVEYDPDSGDYTARLADELMPRVRVSPDYEAMVKDIELDTKARSFVAESLRAARSIIEAIEQRNTTLMRVVRVVLARQREWFEQGPQHLRPLPMIEVADMLGIHVATVSRAVSGKWMHTPRGVVLMRDFFSLGTENAAGEEMSWNAIKAMVEEIVGAEDKAKPLSDNQIAEALKAKGVTIARRTVVKYRDQLGIPAAPLRKIHS